MSKFYMVQATKVTMVLVEVNDDESENEAMTAVADEHLGADVEISSGPFGKGSVEFDRAERHADEEIML